MRRPYFVLLVAMVCLTSARGQLPEQKKQSIAYCRGLQTEAGGFLPAASRPKAAGRSSLRATLAALRALKYFGGTPHDREAAARFVKSCYLPDAGSFTDQPQAHPAPDVATTAVGIMTVVELKMSVVEYQAGVLKYLGEHVRSFEDIRIAAAAVEALGQRPPQAEGWVKQIQALRNSAGSFGTADGTARATGGAVAALLRLGGDVGDKDVVLRAIKAGQRADGGFGKDQTKGSDLETCYRVVRALAMLKEKPADAAKCRAFVGRCRNDDGGYGLAPGQPSGAGPTYFAAIILHWLGEK